MEESVKKLMAQKDSLIKELQDRVEEAGTPDRSPYVCNKCGVPVKFNFVLGSIRNSGKCPSCFHD
jgi:rubrerythrin